MLPHPLLLGLTLLDLLQPLCRLLELRLQLMLMSGGWLACSALLQHPPRAVPCSVAVRWPEGAAACSHIAQQFRIC